MKRWSSKIPLASRQHLNAQTPACHGQNVENRTQDSELMITNHCLIAENMETAALKRTHGRLTVHGVERLTPRQREILALRRQLKSRATMEGGGFFQLVLCNCRVRDCHDICPTLLVSTFHVFMPSRERGDVFYTYQRAGRSSRSGSRIELVHVLFPGVQHCVSHFEESISSAG